MDFSGDLLCCPASHVNEIGRHLAVTVSLTFEESPAVRRTVLTSLFEPTSGKCA